MAESSAVAAVPKEASKVVVRLRGLRKAYQREKEQIPVLDGIDLDIPEGAFEALMGPSGSGKTTLSTSSPASIGRPRGTIEVAGTELSKLSEGRARRRGAPATSASSSSSTTCCRCSPRRRTSRCRCS